MKTLFTLFRIFVNEFNFCKVTETLRLRISFRLGVLTQVILEDYINNEQTMNDRMNKSVDHF